MAKPPYLPGRDSGRAIGAVGRTEPVLDEDRPFAEIRRVLHDVLRIMSLHRWAFFVPFSVVSCAAFLSSLSYPRTYSASTTFERRNDPVMLNLPLSASAASARYFRETMVRDLTSLECMREVADSLGLNETLERDESGEWTEDAQGKRDLVARFLASTVSVSTSSPSEVLDVVQITYTGPDPTLGRRLVDEVKRTYIRRTMTWIHQFLISQRDYFHREADEALEEVKQAQRHETQLRLENPDVDPTNPGAIALTLSQLEMERRELLLRQREQEQELSALRQALAAETPPSLANSPQTALDDFADSRPASAATLQLAGQLRDLEHSIEEMRAKRGVTDEHPEMKELLVKRQWLTGELQTQRQQDGATAVTNAAIGIDAAGGSRAGMVAASPMSGERARLLVQIAAQEAKAKDLAISLTTNEQHSLRLQRAKDDVFQKQEQFAEVMGAVARSRQRHQQIETTLASIEPAIKSIEQDRLLRFEEGEPAAGSTRPISPKAATIVLMALLAGVASGIVFVVLAEVFDHVYRSSSQVARGLGMPLLECIDEIVTGRDRRRLFIRNAIVTPLVVACLLGLSSLAGAMAYLSIEQPWTYQRIRGLPQAAIRLIAEGRLETGLTPRG